MVNNINDAVGIMKFERACVVRQGDPSCGRDCAKCDLCLPTEDVLAAYDMVINALSPFDELVNHPNHYAGEIECIDAMLQQFGVEKVKAFCELSAFKYLWRCDAKHPSPVVDVKKCVWYLNKFLEMEAEND